MASSIQTTRQNPLDSTPNIQGKTGTLTNTRSNDTSPGPEPPGAFPRTASTTGAPTTLPKAARSVLASAQEAAGSVQQQAAPTMQSATQSAGDALTGVGEAARLHFPVSVISTLEAAGVLSGPNTTTSAPSQESSPGPTAGGVGWSLPGIASEADVGKLPEEHVHESNVGSTTDLSATRGPKEPVTENQPTAEPSAAGTNIPVRPLDSSRQAVPSTDGNGTNLDHMTSPHTGTTHGPSGTSTSPDSDVQAALKHSSSVREDRNKPLPPPGGNTNGLPGDAEGHNDTSYTRDQGNREPARTSSNHAHASPGSSSELPGRRATHEEPSQNDVGAKSPSPSTESGGKPSLKQKIKGEAKVLAGKMGKDPKKVEAGTALKQGHVVL